MTDSIPVLTMDEAETEAYDVGFDEFDGLEIDEPDEFELSYFTETARFANIVHPKLRALSGYDDSGHGTYTEGRDVALVHDAELDDVPIEADRVSASMVENEYVMPAWRRGAYDAANGRERYANLE